jgi:hypothetical protein
MQDIHAIKNVIETPILTRDILLTLYSLLALLVLSLFVYLYFRFKKKRAENLASVEPAIPEPPPIDYLAVARERLIEAKSLIAKKDFERFYLLLSEIIKEYLGGVLKIKAIDMTTAEVQAELPSFYLKKEELRDLFRLSDLAKFAGRGKDESTVLEALALAEKFLQDES